MLSTDPDAPEALADRAEYYRKLRETCPVAHVEAQDYYIVTGYKRTRDLLHDHERFTKADGNLLSRGERHLALNQDPPEFNGFRSLYTAYLSPKGVQRWSADCERISNALIDELLPMGSGDLQPLFGKPLPARVTAIALGLPEDDVDRYRAWTDAFLGTMIQNPAYQQRIIAEMYDFFTAEITRRREILCSAGIEQPTREHVGTVLSDNLLSVLMTSQFQGRYLTDDELRRTARGFFVGGVDTTGGLILNTLYRLLERPDLWEQVKADPTLVAAAIEESLRFDPPAIGMFRGANGACDIDDQTIPDGARVLYSTFSANRDPEFYEEPDRFRLDRKSSGQPPLLSFGGGAHFCPGAWTARLESRIALEALVRRLPSLRLTGPVKHFDIVNFWVVSSFPAAWD